MGSSRQGRDEMTWSVESPGQLEVKTWINFTIGIKRQIIYTQVPRKRAGCIPSCFVSVESAPGSPELHNVAYTMCGIASREQYRENECWVILGEL